MFHTFAFPQFQTFGGGMSRIPNPSAKSPISPRLASAGSLGSPAVGSLEASPGSTLDNRGVSPIGARPWTGPGDHHDLPQPVQQQDESAARLPPRPPSAQSVSPRPSSRYVLGPFICPPSIFRVFQFLEEYFQYFQDFKFSKIGQHAFGSFALFLFGPILPIQCPLDKAAALPIATSTPVTEAGRYIQWALYFFI